MVMHSINNVKYNQYRPEIELTGSSTILIVPKITISMSVYEYELVSPTSLTLEPHVQTPCAATQIYEMFE